MDIFQTDDLVFQFINHFAESFSVLNSSMRFLSEKAEYLFYLGIIFYWFSRIHKNREMVITALISACASFSIGSILSHSFYRDRPFVHHTVNQLIEHAANASFPSDHSIGGFVIASSIWLFRKKEGVVWLVLAGMISFSRVWNGVHYPSDVIAGAFIGVISALVVYLLLNRWPAAHKCINAVINRYEAIESKLGISIKKDQSTNHEK